MNKEIGWVVQENLSSDRYVYNAFKEIFEKHSIPHEFVTVIPHDIKLPDFNRDRVNIFYGGITWINELHKDVLLQPGIFFDHETFRMDNYINKWDTLMLNNEAIITTFGGVKDLEGEGETLFFIRPIDDSKSFAGQIMSLQDLKSWRERLVTVNTDHLNDDTEILIGEPWKINKEWRNFIIDGKVITSSLYMKNQFLKKSAEDVPQEMIDFCEKACKIYTPHDVFVLDIAETGGEYFILEAGCTNSAGFYKADQEKLVLELTDYVKRNQWKYVGI